MHTDCLTDCEILIVEDEYFISVELERLLRQAGATVVDTLSDVASAMRAVENSGFDVAVLNVKLIDGEAFGVADALHRQGVPFIFTSGFDREDLPERFADTPHCSKPVGEQEILGELTKLCRTKQDGLVLH